MIWHSRLDEPVNLILWKRSLASTPVPATAPGAPTFDTFCSKQ
uniref:Uncharacterized protein n=1 Tax=Setaria italica TaxID=4555 RepID=K3YP21_SETIT